RARDGGQRAARGEGVAAAHDRRARALPALRLRAAGAEGDGAEAALAREPLGEPLDRLEHGPRRVEVTSVVELEVHDALVDARSHHRAVERGRPEVGVELVLLARADPDRAHRA